LLIRKWKTEKGVGSPYCRNELVTGKFIKNLNEMKSNEIKSNQADTNSIAMSRINQSRL